MGRDVIYILQKAFLRGRRLVEVIINQAPSQLATLDNLIPLLTYNFTKVLLVAIYGH